MINACVTKYGKDTSKDNSLFLFQDLAGLRLSLSATPNKNPTVLWYVWRGQSMRIIFHLIPIPNSVFI